jgi:sterol desaturase/sphingolipid hydroxylase (fatty acid hydroxylase superfamily)
MLESLFSGETMLRAWIYAFVLAGIVAGIATGFFKARKIQPNGFKWTTFRNEAVIAVITLGFSGVVLGSLSKYLTAHGYIRMIDAPAAWWVVLLEYALYFFLFDTWFYWLHRLMHKEPIYRWVHKLHHKSTSPNLLTTVSETPFEAFINGGFVPLFLSIIPVHGATAALILPTNIIMGLYVHSGYEFFPRWWNRTWATKWFITATFHDQHHRYFTGNFGGYTTIWDRICGTMRPKFEADYLKVKDRTRGARVKAATAEV